MLNNLAKYILTTLTYYDVMDYPMTAFEIWKYLTKISRENQDNQRDSCSLGDVIKELENEKLHKFIDEHAGYYFLRGRKNLVAQRIERNKISEYKFKIIRRVAGWLQFVPYVRGAAVAGRLAMKNTQAKSDLDLFIIIARGKIFTGRLLVTALVHMLGKRRYGCKIRNRVCLNHFITDDFEISVKDIFSAHEYVFLAPVFREDLFRKFQNKNKWIKKYKINFWLAVNNSKINSNSVIAQRVKNFLEKILKADSIENYLKKWQQKRINNNPKSKQMGGVILASDSELAFWPNFDNQGPKVFEKFQKRLNDLR